MDVGGVLSTQRSAYGSLSERSEVEARNCEGKRLGLKGSSPFSYCCWLGENTSFMAVLVLAMLLIGSGMVTSVSPRRWGWCTSLCA